MLNMIKYFIYIVFCFFALLNCSICQDSVRTSEIEEIFILSKKAVPERLGEKAGVYLYSGKKNEVLKLENLNANLAMNNTRQIYARIPGVNIWENDGTGAQVSIGLRGLNPNRSWEMNTRQNGYDISSDIFGYPEAYYNPSMEAVEKIEIVRGGAALQFGAQFGGMVNYVLKRTNKKFSFETQNTIGTNNLLSSYNAIGGNHKKFSYYIYNHSRSGNTSRENSGYRLRNTHAFAQYKISANQKISMEYTEMSSLLQQSGGLTDEQFAVNLRQSYRARNWMNIPWQLGSLHYERKVNKNLNMSIKLFGLLAERNSIGFLATPNIKDSINTIINMYNSRQLDRDNYKNLGVEARGIYEHKLGKQKQSLAFGVRFYNANTHRRQKGKGDHEIEYNTVMMEEKYPTDLNFRTKNIAMFAEHQFAVTKAFHISPGIRYEWIQSIISGRLNKNGSQELNQNKSTYQRKVVLGGIGMQYKIKATNIYANISQAYRPILFSDLTPPSAVDIIDENLKDAKGYNAEIGYRGLLSDFLNFDVNVFYLNYKNKIGTIRKYINEDPALSTYQFRTNLGTAVHQGVELYLDCNLTTLLDLSHLHTGDISLFLSTSFIDAEYQNFKVITSTGQAPNVKLIETNLKGNKVEYAPKFIHSAGFTYSFKGISSSFQSRLTSDVFTDANNTDASNATGTVGKLDLYLVHDFSMEFHINKYYNLKLQINNLSDTKYATRRANGYPGPGLIPGEGRGFSLGFGMKI